MDLAPDAAGKPRRVVIQLMPAPFSQGWIGNIRKLATAKWWDGTSINRVQDNYVVQWGDATEKKALPDGLAVVPESEYTATSDLKIRIEALDTMLSSVHKNFPEFAEKFPESKNASQSELSKRFRKSLKTDLYADAHAVVEGWPIAFDLKGTQWPTHCYGMVGVGRNLSPDTGTGAELYTVIGHAPRHLDRNIALGWPRDRRDRASVQPAARDRRAGLLREGRRTGADFVRAVGRPTRRMSRLSSISTPKRPASKPMPTRGPTGAIRFS